MSVGTVTYAGVTLAKGATYTQNRGVAPDKISFKIIPQQTAIAAVGDVVMTFAGDSVTITDCLADKSNIYMSELGFTGTITFEDRRWRWSRFTPFNAHYNEYDANGDPIIESERSLRGIFLDLMTHIGEGDADLSQVSGTLFPEVDAQCAQADSLLQLLADQFGYAICLGFGSDPVSVWPIGSGNVLSTTGSEMAYSEALDPPTPPQYMQVCFGTSEAQARFTTVAVGLDTDGEIKELNDLSYTPSGGWQNEPAHMPNVLAEFGQDEQELAEETVRRWYLVDGFVDSDLELPDGSGVLESLSQILPFHDKLLEVNRKDDGVAHPPPKVFTKRSRYKWPGVRETRKSDNPDIDYEFDRYLGLVKFKKPIHLFVPGGGLLPAEVWVEAAFKVRDSVTRQFFHYVVTTEVDAAGAGYKTHREESLHARSIVLYDSDHAQTSIVSNQASLDSYAAGVINQLVGLYQFTARKEVWYNRLMNGIRIDGIVSQIRHCISDGTDGEPGHFTIASENIEFDMFVRRVADRARDKYITEQQNGHLAKIAKANRVTKGTD